MTHDMRQMTALGRGIEDQSFAIIDAEIGAHDFPPAQWQVVRRVIHATADFIRDLFLVAKIRPQSTRMCIICNRVKPNTLSFRALERFVRALNIPVIASLRETQNYVTSSEKGLGVHELNRPNQQDIDAWQQVINWLEKREPIALNH